ncbi:hypothetical protein BGZ96_008168 [Linnemannia gamsii]|uniref:Uncharacterized protein n=1 Tax=Linnemannia gamsii TaxID=64522 RepID=A0ABQ7K145_9FUNG|nr:hypothetical protein BGZ96_008168 [Linnemannia gamsii]
MQVKNKIDKIYNAFQTAHSLYNSSRFGSQNGEGWRKRVRKKCQHYFILERNWSKAWAEDVSLFTDFLSNMDDATITDDFTRPIQKDRRRAFDFIHEENDDNIDDLTQHDDTLLAESLHEEEDLETYLRNRNTGPSMSALAAASPAVASISATPGPSRSATSGPFMSALSTVSVEHKATTSATGVASTDSQSSSSKATNRTPQSLRQEK